MMRDARTLQRFSDDDVKGSQIRDDASRDPRRQIRYFTTVSVSIATDFTPPERIKSITSTASAYVARSWASKNTVFWFLAASMRTTRSFTSALLRTVWLARITPFWSIV